MWSTESHCFIIPGHTLPPSLSSVTPAPLPQSVCTVPLPDSSLQAAHRPAPAQDDSQATALRSRRRQVEDALEMLLVTGLSLDTLLHFFDQVSLLQR